ncbi:MAG: Xaa-Pro peptidase family protein [Deltaproteobacteria bacterium]|nr:Xaa-Pro peptidase family protein [Deltaproteobacteria bacterium]
MKTEQHWSLLRINKLQESILAAGIDAVFLTYSRSTLYYAGTTQPSALIILPDAYFLLVFRGLDIVLEETFLDIDRIHSSSSYEDAKEMLKSYSITKGSLGMELDILPALQYLKFERLFQDFEIVDISHLILKQRQIKDANEIEYIKNACKILHRGHVKLMEVLIEGTTELDLSAEIEDAQRRAGHEGLYFMRPVDFFMGRGPLASGGNLSKIAGKIQSVSGVGLSSSIPMGASKKTIKKAEMIVVDIPTHYRGYHADQSRTYVLGTPPQICKTMYSAIKEIADRILEKLMPGIRCDALYEMAMSIAHDLGMGNCFMCLGSDSKRVPFIGHGVGLELNEPPLIGSDNQQVLEEGMVIALELEMSASIGEVVKLEDTILIAADGVEVLTISPRQLHQI